VSRQESIEAILKSRRSLKPAGGVDWSALRSEAAEGGCGVVGLASSERVAGRHLLQALIQMRNRGNGKGGGVAAVGLDPGQFGVSQAILEDDYLLSVAYLDPDCRAEVERDHIWPTFVADHVREAPSLANARARLGLVVPPPAVVQYFVRVRPEVYQAFQEETGHKLDRRAAEGEIVFQNSYRLNQAFYAATSETRAFVLSHGKNLLVLKMVAYGDDVVRAYQLEDVRAHVWIGHHRYPTKGRVWHPGGAHPFVGLNEALVHNGDFANYHSIVEYLAQRGIYPHFLTDTEVSVQVFDLLYRTYGYPLEAVIEALAPTTERDFALLPADRQQLYRQIQRAHIHCSPDGPWFFLIAQSDIEAGAPAYRLTGITDTSMLRPQVFAWQQGGPEEPAIGLIGSEKQAIDAVLASLTREDNRFWSRADRYWNARGGSHTDGGAFVYSVRPDGHGRATLSCSDKFGRPLAVDVSREPYRTNGHNPSARALPVATATQLFHWILERLPEASYDDLRAILAGLEAAASTEERLRAFKVLALLMDRRYPTGGLRRSSVLALVDGSLARLVAGIGDAPSPGLVYVSLKRPFAGQAEPGQAVVLDAREYPVEGEGSAALALVELYRRGFRRIIVANTRGHRFLANGLGRDSAGLIVDIFGSPGDYLASGLDGAEVFVHNNAQDQVAQILNSGKLVIRGDVGQTFGYAAKGGQIYILGNAAGRPLINAVGRPRVIINGTCLDYLAESFMAGDALNGGGFIILNGLSITDDGRILDLDTPYPGSNLFSLASGGAIYARDPHRCLTGDQLNGGKFVEMTADDWTLIKPYLKENARLFNIPLERLLSVDGRPWSPEAVYRKIMPRAVRALQAEEAWVHKK
jgi:glutamate synthase domain-containing protein 1/glutamate synthase domain-containing protein 3